VRREEGLTVHYLLELEIFRDFRFMDVKRSILCDVSSVRQMIACSTLEFNLTFGTLSS